MKFLRKKMEQSWSVYFRLVQAAKLYWLLFLLGVLGTIGLSLADAGFTWMIKPIIDKGFVARDYTFIQYLPFLVIFIFIVRGLSGFLSNYCINRVSRNVVRDFRRKIFAHMLRLPTTFYDKNSSGHLIATIIYNVEQVASATSDSLVTLVRETTLTISLIVVMFVGSWRLSALFLVMAPFIAWVVKACGVRMRRLSGNVQNTVGMVTHVAEEGIQGYKIVRLFGGENYENKKFHQVTKQNQQQELKIVITNSLGSSVVQLLLGIPIAISLFFATMPSFHVTAGSFGVIIAAMISLLRPVRRLTLVHSEIQKGIAGAESIFKLLDEALEKDTGTKALECSKGKIEFRQVDFRYDSTKQLVLQNISFCVEPGETVALVGRSGSGKTSLINLLPRFYDISAGHIFIDEVDVHAYRLTDLRRQFALVSQQTLLFNDTIRNNIAYPGENNYSEADILLAAEAANALEFIQATPKGLDTLIGENGLLLSGGQRQRIAIARALLKQAPILILDEATSALDTESERNIQSALDQLMKTRTTLVIAHRLSTIENADRIIVLDHGMIVEMGTHQALLAKQSHYARLYKMQFQGQAQSGILI